ncbi:zinc finger protein 888-like [Culex pipiens pallens]|uniref:zinc finger protein 888-like n=1 Tax=Culex pipiens pallens TaxID=42434 RepID=UPI00195471A8|nr:zinc finger protein 888-like [Culex pipiens pallens]
MDFEKVCRLCLEERERLRPITAGEDTFLRDIFRNILQIEVYPNDQLPQNICATCVTSLIKLHSTIELFRANDLKLRNQLYGFVEVKTEIIEETVEPAPLPNPKKEDEQEENGELPEAEYLDEDLLVDPSEIKSPEYEDLKGFTKNEDQDESDLDITADWKVPTDESDSQLERPKRKQGRPRVRPMKQRRKGVFGRPRTNFRDPNRPRKNDHKCYICMSESLGSSEALFVHLSSHTDQLPYTCTVCVQETVVINQVTTLNIHKRMHLLPEKCPHCDKRFSGKHNIELHILMLHQELAPQDESPAPCPTCGKVFLSEKALRFHMHSHNQRIACEICGKMYHSKTKLRVHIRRVHEKTGKVECHICHKMLNSLDAVQSHINIMHTNEKVQCKYCPKTYTSKTSLRLHEKRHETIPEGKEMSNDWKQFYTFVEGNEDLKPSARMKRCNLCGATVLQIGTHLAKRHFPKEFRCAQCETNFSDRKALEVHMLEHSVGKFLKCPICEHEFTERKYLVKHLKTKKHRDHPLAQNTDWLDAKYPSTVPKRIKSEGGAVQEVQSAVESIGAFVQE